MSQHPVRTFAKQALASYGFQLALMAIAFIASVLIARILGPEARGVYAWLLTLNGVLASVVLLGFDTVLRKQGQKPIAEQAAWYTTASITGVIVLVLIAIPLYFILQTTQIGRDYPDYLKFTLGMVAIGHVFTCGLMLMAGQNKIWHYNWLSGLPRVMAAAIVVALVGAGALTLKSAILAQFLTITVFAALVFLLLRKQPGFQLTFNPVLLKHNWRFMGYAYLALLTTLLLLKIDQLLLGAYGLKAELGQYAVAVSLIDTLQLGPMLAATFLLPRLTALDINARRGFFWKIWLLLAVIMACASIFGWLIAPWAIPLLFGIAYVPAIYLFQVLLLALFCLSLMTLTQHALAVYTESWPLIAAPLTAFIVNLILNLLWIPEHGALGAAYASVCAYTLGLLLVSGLMLKFSR